MPPELPTPEQVADALDAERDATARRVPLDRVSAAALILNSVARLAKIDAERERELAHLRSRMRRQNSLPEGHPGRLSLNDIGHLLGHHLTWVRRSLNDDAGWPRSFASNHADPKAARR